MSLRPLRARDWNASTARHLLNRAGFGVPSASLDWLTEAGLNDAVDAIVNYDQFRDNGEDPDFLVAYEQYAEAYNRELSREERQRRVQALNRQERQAAYRLRFWWLQRMYTTGRPLQEKMALFWHGHFATEDDKVRQSSFNHQLNEIFRQNAVGNFKTLTTEVGKSPSMLIYLDNRNNRKNAPNENWARELMELFTLGIGAYTEDDIKEAARAFTGWTFNPLTWEFVFDIRNHDFGAKTFLGRRGLFDGYDIIDILFEQEAVAPFLCRKLWLYFVHEEPNDEIIAGLARTLRENDYEIKPVIAQLFRSQAFYDAAHRASQLKSPVVYMLQLFDHLKIDLATYAEVDSVVRGVLLIMRLLGQDLFNPPNVKGWDGNRAWISSQTLLTRYNVAGSIINGNVQLEPPDADLDTTLSDIEELRREMELLRRNESIFEPARFYDGMDGKTVGEVLDALLAKMIHRPVTAEQRRILLGSLGMEVDESTTFRLSNLREQHSRGLAHLITSLADYQVC